MAVIAYSASQPPRMPREVHDGRQQRQRDDAGDDARDHEEPERVDGGRFERVDLLGDLHGRDLGPDARADASGEQQAGRERAGLADERDAEAGRHEGFGPEPFERGTRVEREDEADGEPRRADERHRTPSELYELTQRLAALVRRPQGADERAAREDREVAGGAEGTGQAARARCGHQNTQ